MGQQQMHTALADQNQYQLVISSPLQRCAAFARQFSSSQQLPLTLEPAFQEYDFGLWEGKTVTQIEQMDASALMQFYANPEQHCPPGAESLQHFQQRINKAWYALLQQHQGKHMLIVTHAGVIRHLYSLILNLSYQQSLQINIAQAGLTRFQHWQQQSEQHTTLIFHHQTP